MNRSTKVIIDDIREVLQMSSLDIPGEDGVIENALLDLTEVEKRYEMLMVRKIDYALKICKDTSKDAILEGLCPKDIGLKQNCYIYTSCTECWNEEIEEEVK